MLSTSEFSFIAQLVKQEAGIFLETGKEYLVETRLEPLAKELGFTSIGALIANLQSINDKAKCRQVIESLTTHETSFFRDISPFETLIKNVIPELLNDRKAEKEFSIWCGAASSGQEPYTMCILLKENFPELAGWNVKFLATDISQAILSKAKTGIYSQIEVNRGLNPILINKYFNKDVSSNYILKPEILNMVKFAELNLLHSFLSIPDSDLIMLRNVLIYFDINTKKLILEKIYKNLKSKGYLFLGSAESTFGIHDGFECMNLGKTICYRKKQ